MACKYNKYLREIMNCRYCEKPNQESCKDLVRLKTLKIIGTEQAKDLFEIGKGLYEIEFGSCPINF